MSSLRHAPSAASANDAYAACGHGGIPALRWGPSGLRLFLTEASEPTQMIETRFFRPSARVSHLPHADADTLRGEDVHVLHGDDRLLLVTEMLQQGASDGWCALPHRSPIAPTRTQRNPASSTPVLRGGAHRRGF